MVGNEARKGLEDRKVISRTVPYLLHKGKALRVF